MRITIGLSEIFFYSSLFAFSSFSFAVDTDHDTLPDEWELANGRDPTVADYMVTVKSGHSCALDDTGVVCWSNASYNSWGQIDVPALDNPVQVSVGYRHTCALDDTGVVCWGRDNSGQATVPSLSNPTQVSAGSDHTCALDDTGAVCWGDIDNWDINPPALSNPTHISGGGGHSCALDDTGVVCWGHNGMGQISVPVLSNASQVSANANGTCAIDDTGVVCWGDDDWGQTNIPTLSNPAQVSVGSHHVCAVDDTGVVCWGHNGMGRSNVPALYNPAQVSSGDVMTCALDVIGVVCWGQGSDSDFTKDLIFDPDGDGFSNQECADVFPLDPTKWSDDDGVCIVPRDNVDSDGDGTNDNADAFPHNAAYSSDSDSDGMPDSWETLFQLDPNDPSDATSDRDNDGIWAIYEFLAGTIPSNNFDVDGNLQFDALTDGLLILRFMFGFSGSSLVEGAIASDAFLTDPIDIVGRLHSIENQSDIDGNGQLTPLSDGLLILRYLFGFEGEALINGAIKDDATRTTAAEIEAYLETLMPSI